MVIAVGTVRMRELKRIASTADSIFCLDDYKTIESIKNNIPQYICNDIVTPVKNSATVSVASGIARKDFTKDLAGFDMEDGIRAGMMYLEFDMSRRKMILVRSDQPVTVFASQSHSKPSRAIHDFTFNITG